MERIIAGRFQTKTDSDVVLAQLEQYIHSGDICVFHNNAPGQHDAIAGGGDEDEDPAAIGADGSAAKTALASGLAAGAIGAIGGPVVALAAAATGAYLGSLAGAMSGMDDENKMKAPERRPGGVILAVRIAPDASEGRVIATLRGGGAADVEEAMGEWRDGDWTDFDPVAKPHLVSDAP